MHDTSLQKTQFRLLCRHFFGRFFDTEAVSAPGADMNLLFAQIWALMVLPGLLKVMLSMIKYGTLCHGPLAQRDHAAMIDEHIFLCLSMLLTGFVTVFEWDALFPDRKDFYNLAPLPINARIMFFAKIAALSLFVILFNVAVNGMPAIFFPGLVTMPSFIPGSAGSMVRPGDGTKYIAAHAVSLVLSSLFVFTSLLTVRALFTLVIPARFMRMGSRMVQLAILLVLLCALFSGVDADRLTSEGNRLVYLLPTFWFLGLCEFLIGHRQPLFIALTQTALWGVAISCIISAVCYLFGYRASMLKGFQSESAALYPNSWIRRLSSWLLHHTCLRGSIEKAFFHFSAKTLRRRPEHLLYTGAFVSVGVALLYAAFYALRKDSFPNPNARLTLLLACPLAISFFTLAGLRFAFSIPADLKANWLFQLTDKIDLERAYRGVRRLMVCAIAIPLAALFVPCCLLLLGPRMTALYTSYAFILGLLLIELFIANMDKLPFTCSYLPGKTNIKLLWLAYVSACFFYSFVLAAIGRWLLEDVARCLVFLALAGIALMTLHRRRASFLRSICAIKFEELPIPATTVLRIEP